MNYRYDDDYNSNHAPKTAISEAVATRTCSICGEKLENRIYRNKPVCVKCLEFIKGMR